MSDWRRQYRPGEALPGLPSGLLNAVVEHDRHSRRARLQELAGDVDLASNPNVVLVRNDLEHPETLPRFGVVELAGPAIEPDDGYPETVAEFLSRPVFSGIDPTHERIKGWFQDIFRAEWTTAHRGRMALLLEPCPPGRIARAAIAGCWPARIWVRHTRDRFADLPLPQTGGTSFGRLLQSQPSGCAEILTPLAGVGIQYAIVKLGVSAGGYTLGFTEGSLGVPAAHWSPTTGRHVRRGDVTPTYVDPANDGQIRTSRGNPGGNDYFSHVGNHTDIPVPPGIYCSFIRDSQSNDDLILHPPLPTGSIMLYNAGSALVDVEGATELTADNSKTRLGSTVLGDAAVFSKQGNHVRIETLPQAVSTPERMFRLACQVNVTALDLTAGTWGCQVSIECSTNGGNSWSTLIAGRQTVNHDNAQFFATVTLGPWLQMLRLGDLIRVVAARHDFPSAPPPGTRARAELVSLCAAADGEWPL